MNNDLESLLREMELQPRDGAFPNCICESCKRKREDVPKLIRALRRAIAFLDGRGPNVTPTLVDIESILKTGQMRHEKPPVGASAGEIGSG